MKMGNDCINRIDLPRYILGIFITLCNFITLHVLQIVTLSRAWSIISIFKETITFIY